MKNAVKFTPEEGYIHISSRDEGDLLVVEVEDTGVGISADAIDSIFRPFEQAGLANDHRFGGLGLGLFISKNIVEMHSGTITVSSEGKAKGSVFTVRLPAGKTEAQHKAPPIEPPAAIQSQPLNILLVEDHEATAGILTQLLRKSNHVVGLAASVREALAIADMQSFDVVVSDIGLPDGTGYELMDQLRSRYGLSGIALTGYGTFEDHVRSQAAGFVTHLTKPVDINMLRKALLEWATTKGG